MPDEEKPAGEPAPSGEKPEGPESAPAAEAKTPAASEKPSSENVPPAAPPAEAPAAVAKPPAPADSEGEKPAAPVKKATPAAAEAGATDAPAAGEKPAAEKPAPKAAAAKPKADGEKPAAKKVSTIMETTPWEGPLVDRLRQHFGGEITECSSYVGDQFLVAKLPGVFAILQYLKAEEGFDYLVDVTAVHYPTKAKPFEVIWILYSYAYNLRIRVKTEVAEGESPRSVDSLYASANWLEREVYDMFGIAFAEHPNMTRILLPDGWQGYPLRKDYSIIQQDQDWVRENINIESGQ